MAPYELAFDLGSPANLFGEWWIFAVPATLLILVLSDRFPRIREAKKSNMIGWFAVAFTGCIAVILVTVNFIRAERLRELSQSGNAIISEGCMAIFSPANHDPSSKEWFQIGDKGFGYSEDEETPAFHHTESHGGPIHSDSKLKVTSIFGEIIRLEIQDHACAPAPTDARRPPRLVLSQQKP